MFCLASTFIKLAKNSMNDATAIRASLPAEAWNMIRDQARKIVEPSRIGNSRVPHP
jgi:hypothetical protein